MSHRLRLRSSRCSSELRCWLRLCSPCLCVFCLLTRCSWLLWCGCCDTFPRCAFLSPLVACSAAAVKRPPPPAATQSQKEESSRECDNMQRMDRRWETKAAAAMATMQTDASSCSSSDSNVKRPLPPHEPLPQQQQPAAKKARVWVPTSDPPSHSNKQKAVAQVEAKPSAPITHSHSPACSIASASSVACSVCSAMATGQSVKTKACPWTGMGSQDR